MPGYYIYLVSSLPMLHFSGKLPFSFEKFIYTCRGQLSEYDVNLLESVSGPLRHFNERKQPTLNKWYAFDTSLRNELAKIRAARKKADPFKYIKPVGYTEPAITHIAINAYRNPSLLESEKMLDEARWKLLDELETGHYFNLDFLLIYALKLLILERWERIHSADKTRLIESMAAGN